MGEVLTREQAAAREAHYSARGLPCSYSLYDAQFVIDATLFGNAARFANASCAPNLKPVKFSPRAVVGCANMPRVMLTATRDIAAGEELAWSYNASAAQPAEEKVVVRSVYGGRRSRSADADGAAPVGAAARWAEWAESMEAGLEGGAPAARRAAGHRCMCGAVGCRGEL